MHVLVVGGTGTVGAPLTSELARRGHDVRVLVRRTSRASRGQAPGVTYLPGDLASGAGLVAALSGVQVVVDVVNVQSLRRRRLEAVLVQGSARLLEQARRAGVGHYVGLSVVGVDAVPMPYYQAKVRQEQVVEAAPLPWTLLRATQFHQLLDAVLGAAWATAGRAGLLAVPAVPLQPVDAAEVAALLADAGEGPPAGRLPDAGGPEVTTVPDLARQWLHARGRTARVVRLPLPGAAGRAVRAGLLTAADRAVGRHTFAQWLAAPRT